MQNEIKIGEKYVHYKTKDIYEIINICFLQVPKESGLDMEKCISYKKENDEKIWVRPIKMFLEKVINEEGVEIQRFEKVIYEKNHISTEVKENVFDVWNNLKKDIDNNCPDFNFSEKEIWWCSLGKNIGNEQDGKNNNFERPIVIFKKWNSDFFIGLPMTSKNKINEKNKKYYFEYDLDKDEIGYVILTQIKSLSKKRLIRRMGKMGDAQFFELEKDVQKLLFKG